MKRTVLLVTTIVVCVLAFRLQAQQRNTQTPPRQVVFANLPADRTGTEVALYSQPHTGSTVESVPLGTRLVVEGETETAYKVVTPSGRRGWIAKVYTIASKEPRLESAKALIRQLTDAERKQLLDWLSGGMK